MRRKDIYDVPEPVNVTLYVECLGLHQETFIPYVECAACDYAIRHHEHLQCSHPEAKND